MHMDIIDMQDCTADAIQHTYSKENDRPETGWRTTMRRVRTPAAQHTSTTTEDDDRPR